MFGLRIDTRFVDAQNHRLVQKQLEKFRGEKSVKVNDTITGSGILWASSLQSLGREYHCMLVSLDSSQSLWFGHCQKQARWPLVCLSATSTMIEILSTLRKKDQILQEFQLLKMLKKLLDAHRVIFFYKCRKLHLHLAKAWLFCSWCVSDQKLKCWKDSQMPIYFCQLPHFNWYALYLVGVFMELLPWNLTHKFGKRRSLREGNSHILLKISVHRTRQ